MAASNCTIDGCEKATHGGRICPMHRWRFKKYGTYDKPGRPAVDRFDEKTVVTPGCWLWTATLNNKGYGQFWNGETLMLAHRWSYEHHIGPIPDGLVIDHLCRTPACVNPLHLEPVTQPENMARAALNACRRGHPFTPENTYLYPNGQRRECRTCQQMRQRNRRRST